MSTFSQKFVGAAMAGAVSMSSISPAFALSLNSDLHALTKIKHEDTFVQSNASASASADADLRGSARCKSFTGSDLIRCKALIEERADVKGEAKADLETHGNFVSTLRKDKEHVQDTETRTLSVLKRLFNHVALVVKRACKAENSDATLVRQCVASAKSRIQLKVTAMIDAAFGVN